MIELKNVSFSYGEKEVLRNVSFKTEEGEALVIMGPSGSGKSTILRLILGLECPYQGEVLINGDNICTMSEPQKRETRKKMGMVFQDGALFDSLTVGENVGYYLFEHTKMTLTDIEEKVREMLGFVGLNADEIIDKLPEQLSGGMQRRVAIGRALLSTDPRLMLFDEPTTGLDPFATENVLKLIGRVNKEKDIATIAVTHQIADAIQIADKYVVIHEGEVAFEGTLEDISGCDDERLRNFLQPFKQSFRVVQQRNFVDS